MSALTSFGKRVVHGAAWVWNPAGDDELVARACMDLGAGRFGLAAEALRECRGDTELRARRSALLAAAAADVDAAEYWLAEAPTDRDALLLAARTAVMRACRAQARGLIAQQLVSTAAALCQRAAGCDPQDPTAWSALLMLRAGSGTPGMTIHEGYAQWASRAGAPAYVVDGRNWSVRIAEALAGARHAQRSLGVRPFFTVARTAAALLDTLVSGPWDLLFEVWARDALCREAHAWFLESLHVQDALAFAALVRNATPRTSNLQLLPLSANLADYQRRASAGPVNTAEDGASAVWRSPMLREACLQTFADWFAPVYQAGGWRPVREFSLLAHGLFMVGERNRAAIVMEAMKPFACPYPWSVTAADGDGTRAFLSAAHALGVSAPRRMSAGEAEARYG